jgi:Contact-dependent growth inhibition CdiA C-terminal domain
VASDTALTPPKVLPSLPDTMLRPLSGQSDSLWKSYGPIANTRLISGPKEHVNAPLSARSKPPRGQGAGAKTQPVVRIGFENVPPGTRIGTRASGTAFHIDTGKGSQPPSGAPYPKTDPDGSALDNTAAHASNPSAGGKAVPAGAGMPHAAGDKHAGAKPAFASKDVRSAATGHLTLNEAFGAARLLSATMFPPALLLNYFTPLQVIHGALGILSFIPEGGSLAAAVDGAVYAAQALYAQATGDKAAANEYWWAAATDVGAALIGVADGDAGITKLVMKGGGQLAFKGFALAGHAGNVAVAGRAVRAVTAASRARGAVVTGTAVATGIGTHISQSVASGDGSSADAASQGTPSKNVQGEVLQRKEGGKLSGVPEPVDPKASTITKDAIRRQNDSARILSGHGLNVEQLPKKDTPGPSPDLDINGVKADVYSPINSKTDNIALNIQNKVDKQQVSNIVLNLEGSDAKVDDILTSLRMQEVKGLKDLYIIDKTGVVTLYRF